MSKSTKSRDISSKPSLFTSLKKPPKDFTTRSRDDESTADAVMSTSRADAVVGNKTASSTISKSHDDSNPPLTLDDLPNECVLRIFSYLSFDDVAKCRAVSRAYDTICRQLLNAGFANAERYHSRLFQRIRAQLPRRESERRQHALARHVDILTAIETRLSLLSMTFKKYIDNGVSCFVPGRVLDEMFRVLKVVDAMPRSPNGTDASAASSVVKSHELLRELRDISSMAMEYFDERLVPFYRENHTCASASSSANFSSSFFIGLPPLPSNATFLIDNVDIFNNFANRANNGNNAGGGVVKPPPSVVNVTTDGNKASSSSGVNACVSASRFDALQRRLRVQNDQLCIHKKEIDALHNASKRQQDKLAYQNRLIAFQNRRIDAIGKALLEYENRFDELRNSVGYAASATPSLSATRKRRNAALSALSWKDAEDPDAECSPSDSCHDYELRSTKRRRK